MVLQPRPNPADEGYPYNPEAAAWLANYYSQSFSFGGGGGGGSSWVNSYLDYSHVCVENGGEASASVFNYEVNKQTNSPGNNGTVTIQTGTMDYYTFTSIDSGKTWHQGNYISSKPIYSTIRVPQTTGDFNTTLGYVNDGFSAAGITAGSAELYTNTYAPAQIAYTTINGTRSTISSVKFIDVVSTAGKYALYAGITVDVSLSLAGYQSWGKTILNTSIGLLPLVIGTGPGLIVGVGYFVIDKTGVFDRPTNLTPYQPPMYAVPDATRVNIPLRNP